MINPMMYYFGDTLIYMYMVV